ncbi:hypothetical protein [Tenacibaculum finnmarkense]|uniref:hypothetical protein n=1 Tax=Tenacibaculum finnmarkense TaxID=2781243 RepID=UPI00187BC2C9|nr:hypothetical protein [Tenacibaculum finnmarkense]MBE7661150.1 hypothetical protein [Tenacibaculum finnmarkense genomovar finnmarkense]MCG8251492.1 hypothetical protein [Tenacibaculum finnmarkense genomovar finnmarkense]MCG8820044.1 hypothetical protein [Tenacibaculum finnmarkense]MCG8892572.1 hypothetical protein [Tenacibaculum finnmarkense]MCG8901107.1 hypothetical protein [Tenacibaculum finnmarkense]
MPRDNFFSHRKQVDININLLYIFKLQVLVVISFLFYSCTDSTFKKENTPVLPANTNSNNVTIIDSSSISTNLDLFKSNTTYFHQDSLLYFAKKNKIYYYNFNKNKISNIKIKDSIYGFLNAIVPINKDSIAILQSNPEKLIIFNIKADTRYEYPLGKINFKTTNFFFNKINLMINFNDVNFNIDFNTLKYDEVKKQFHVGLTPYDSHLLEGFEKTKRIGVYDVKLRRWVAKYASPKGVYGTRGAFTFGSNTLSNKEVLFKGDTVIVSYPVNHKIQVYLRSIFIKNVNFTSKYSKKIKHPLKLHDADNIEENRKLMHSTAYYGKVFYHKKLKIYSRVYFDEQKPFKKNGLYNNSFNRKKYLIFLDANFNYVGEYRMPKNYKQMLGTSDGFILTTKNKLSKYKLKIEQ